MSARSMNVDDPLEDFAPRAITLDGVTKTVQASGGGPAVIVMTAMPGISPQVARFSRWVRDAGLTVYLPSLFGRDGAVPDAAEGAAGARAAIQPFGNDVHPAVELHERPRADLHAVARIAVCRAPDAGHCGSGPGSGWNRRPARARDARRGDSSHRRRQHVDIAACANLGGYLLLPGATLPLRRRLLQGECVGRPSMLGLAIDAMGAIRVSGAVLEFARGVVTT